MIIQDFLKQTAHTNSIKHMWFTWFSEVVSDKQILCNESNYSPATKTISKCVGLLSFDAYKCWEISAQLPEKDDAYSMKPFINFPLCTVQDTISHLWL